MKYQSCMPPGCTEIGRRKIVLESRAHLSNSKLSYLVQIWKYMVLSVVFNILMKCKGFAKCKGGHQNKKNLVKYKHVFIFSLSLQFLRHAYFAFLQNLSLHAGFRHVKQSLADFVFTRVLGVKCVPVMLQELSKGEWLPLQSTQFC